MNQDTVINLTLRSEVDKLQDICLVKKVYSTNQHCISKKFLENYSVDYDDPTNFIYVYNKDDISDFKTESGSDYISILKLYMKCFYLEMIVCANIKITSFPIYPNMKSFYGPDNKLTSFPVQPSMNFFWGVCNQLTSFPVQPNMTHFYGQYNQLTTFPAQPKMTNFEGEGNKLEYFPTQPKMKNFEGNNNLARL